MLLPLIYYGNPMLRKKGKQIGAVTDELRELAINMIETMDANNGIGLAAPQIGKSIRMFVLRNYIEGEDGHLHLTDPQTYINPVITVVGDEVQTDTEGCLSIPHIRAEVTRPLHIKVEATNLNGERVVEEIIGYKARVILHENDHINGVLFIDRIGRHEREKLEPQLREIKKKYV